MRPGFRRCLLRRIACQSAAQWRDIPKEGAKLRAILDLDDGRFQITAVFNPADDRRSVIRPYVKPQVIDYLKSISG